MTPSSAPPPLPPLDFFDPCGSDADSLSDDSREYVSELNFDAIVDGANKSDTDGSSPVDGWSDENISSPPLVFADELPGIGGNSGSRSKEDEVVAPLVFPLLPFVSPLWNQSPQSNGDVSLPPDNGGRREVGPGDDDDDDDDEVPLRSLRLAPSLLLPDPFFSFSQSTILSSKLFSSTPLLLYLAKSGRGSFGGRRDDGVEADDENEDGFTPRSLLLPSLPPPLLLRCPERLFILTCGRRFLLSLVREEAPLLKSLSYPGRGGKIDAAAPDVVDVASPPASLGVSDAPESLGNFPPGLDRAAMARSFAARESSLPSSAPPFPLLLVSSSPFAAWSMVREERLRKSKGAVED